jgi:phage N-6-adenine-methyltransferase
MVDKVLFSSESEEWQTPKDFYDKLNETYHFNLDPCTTKDNPLGTKYFFTKDTDGLKNDWPKNTYSVFINPPYNREISKWLKKAYEEYNKNENIRYIIFLLPARVDTSWFHNYIYNPNIPLSWMEIPDIGIYFIKGRLKFTNSKNSAPFPSMLVVFSRK